MFYEGSGVYRLAFLLLISDNNSYHLIGNVQHMYCQPIWAGGQKFARLCSQSSL